MAVAGANREEHHTWTPSVASSVAVEGPDLRFSCDLRILRESTKRRGDPTSP